MVAKCCKGFELSTPLTTVKRGSRKPRAKLTDEPCANIDTRPRITTPEFEW